MRPSKRSTQGAGVEEPASQYRTRGGDTMCIRTTIKALAVCVLLVGLTVSASSGADSRRTPREAGSQSDRFIEEQAQQLGLDEKTMAAIRTIVDASRTRGESLRVELRTAYTQMRALLSQDLPDEA